MVATSAIVLALAATVFGLPQVSVPEGYKTVYVTSMVNPKFVMVPKAPAAAGSTMVVQQITNKPDQQWYLKEGSSKIQLAGTTLCLDAGAKTNWKDMAQISLKECADGESQQWNVMADGRIALEASKPQECIDLQYMRATPGNAVGLYACAGLGNIGARDKGINWPLVEA